MWPGIAAAISVTTGKPFSIEQRASVGGGCINPAYRIEGRGVVYFVKTSSADRRETFAAEASALEEIAASGTLRVPRVVCHGGDETASWLVLEHIALQRHGDLERLGRRLAALHRVRAESFGWSRNNVLGATPQINTPAADWLQFWREQRLGYQLRLAADNGYRGALQRSGRRLMDRLSDLLSGHRPAPSLLHGDLWSGNLAFDAVGEPVVFDPATYYGDRETDLAMTELFGRLLMIFMRRITRRFPFPTATRCAGISTTCITCSTT